MEGYKMEQARLKEGDIVIDEAQYEYFQELISFRTKYASEWECFKKTRDEE